MLLLPLVHHSIANRFEPDGEGGSPSIHIAMAIAGHRLRFAVAATHAGGAARAAGPDIAGVRDRLKALYGGDARLTLRAREAGGLEVLLDLPYERTSEAALASSSPPMASG